MLFNRWITAPGGQMPIMSRQGQGLPFALKPTLIATDAAATLTVAQLAGGAVTWTGLTAGRIMTTPTAALILAAAPDMDIGDTFTLFFSVTTAFAATWAAGAGVTLAGRATVPASTTLAMVVVEKLSATTVSWTAL